MIYYIPYQIPRKLVSIPDYHAQQWVRYSCGWACWDGSMGNSVIEVALPLPSPLSQAVIVKSPVFVRTTKT